MALKITKASDPITVDRLNMVIYAAPGLGKTSLAFTSAVPLLLDFDNGAHRAANRADMVRVTDWADVENITADDLAPFKTVIVDTAGRALDALTADIIRKNPKHGRGGSLTLQGYGELKARFIAFLKHLNTFGKDVVLIAHMDEQRSGDEIVERLDVQGGSKGEIYKVADAMGRLSLVNGKRQLRFSPTDTAFGKNPAQLDLLNIPVMTDPTFGTFLGDVIAQTKDKMNALTAVQKEAVAEQKWFTENLPTIEDAEGINAILGRAKTAGRAVSLLVKARAEELGLTYDKAAGAYVKPADEEGEADPFAEEAA